MLSINHTATCDLLTHWGRVTHKCVSKLTFIGSDNCLSPRRRHAIIWTNAGMLLIGPFGTKFSKISIEIVRVSFNKIRLKGSSAKWSPFCLGLNELRHLIGSVLTYWRRPRENRFSQWEIASHMYPRDLRQKYVGAHLTFSSLRSCQCLSILKLVSRCFANYFIC